MRKVLNWLKHGGGDKSSRNGSGELSSQKQRKQTRRRSTKTFKVKANLVPDPIIATTKEQDAKQHQQQQQQPQSRADPILKPRWSMASTSIADSDTASEENGLVGAGMTQQQPYYRGGGYCRHAHASYEERWSKEHVDMAVASWKMTLAQREKLLALQERIRDVDHPFLNDAHQAVYFLKDECGNVELAEKLLRKVAKARKESPFQFDSIITDHVLPDDYDYFPMCVLQGTDHEGDPIDITRTGVADCWGLYKRHGREAMIRHAIYHQEVVSRGVWHDDYEREHGRKVTQFTVIFDLQGLSTRHLRPGLIPTCGFLARLLQDTYPEMVKRVLIIHSPPIFKMIWGLVKHFFDPELRDLMIFGTDEADSQQLLERFIDKDVLPHCIHPGGLDGRVARGYEHVIMEGGLIPEEGTYTTPEHCKKGRTRAEEDAFLQLTQNKKDDAVATCKVPPEQGQKRRVAGRQRPLVPPKHCQVLGKGSFEVIHSLQECQTRITLEV